MKNLMIILLALISVSCSQSKKEENKSTSTAPEIVEEKAPVLEKAWESDTTLITPESVLFNKNKNILYVSCIGGVPPNEKDGDGFIAKISPEDGSIIEKEWITGLDAPKGMGLVAGKLYVTNIDEIRIFDIESGRPLETIPVADAQFLNDIAVDSDYNVYISDSNTNKIHKLSATGELTTWMDDENLGGPNGLFHDGDRMMLATFGKGDFKSIGYEDNSVNPVVDSIPKGDGVVKVGVDFLVSNWDGEVYYITSEWNKFKILDTKEAGANAADIEFIQDKMLLLVPTFFGNQVVAYKLSI